MMQRKMQICFMAEHNQQMQKIVQKAADEINALILLLMKELESKTDKELI